MEGERDEAMGRRKNEKTNERGDINKEMIELEECEREKSENE